LKSCSKRKKMLWKRFTWIEIEDWKAKNLHHVEKQPRRGRNIRQTFTNLDLRSLKMQCIASQAKTQTTREELVRTRGLAS
jgi:hypothetical protein